MATTTPELKRSRSAKSASRPGDRVFSGLSRGSGITLLVIMAAIAVFLSYRAVLAISKDSTNFFTTFEWNPAGDPPVFGIAVLAFGTVVSSVVAMVIAVPVAIGIALFISHYAPRRLAKPLAYVVDLLAAVPSIIYGLWGAIFLVPYLAGLNEWLDQYLGWTYVFDKSQDGVARNLFTVGILLAIMILPIITNVTREVFLQVPKMHEEAASPSAPRAGRSSACRCCPSAAPASSPPPCWASAARSARPWPSPWSSPQLPHLGPPARPGRRHLRPEHRRQVQRGQRVRPGRPHRVRPRPLRHHPAGQRRGPLDHRPPQGVLGAAA